MSWCKETIFSYNLRKKLIKKKSSPKKNIDIRPTSYILRNILIICFILFFIGVLSGIFFGENILSFINSKSDTPLKVKGQIWLPIVIFFGVLMLYFWGIVIIFGGITANLIKSKTTGVIKKSKIKSFYDSDDGDVYYIFSEVKYKVNHIEYQNERQHNFSTTDKDKAIQKLKSISPGDKVLILYDPKNPYLMNLECNDIDIKGEIFAGIGFITGATLFSIFFGVIIFNFIY